MFRFDPWSLLNALKHKAKSLGAHYVEGEVVDFGFQTDTNHEKINSVKVSKHLRLLRSIRTELKLVYLCANIDSPSLFSFNNSIVLFYDRVFNNLFTIFTWIKHESFFLKNSITHTIFWLGLKNCNVGTSGR